LTSVGSATVCVGGSVVLRSGYAVGNQWYMDGKLIAGVSAGEYEASRPGSYSVRVKDVNGCESLFSNGVMVAMNGLPAQAVVQAAGEGTLVSSSSVGNEWYKDGVLIVGSKSQVYKPTEAGYYSVRVVSQGCAGEVSAGYYYAKTGMGNVSAGEYVRVFPNPVESEMKVVFLLNGNKMVDLEIYDMVGRRVLEQKGLVTGTRVLLTGLAKGMYRYQVMGKSGKLIYSYKFMKN